MKKLIYLFLLAVIALSGCSSDSESPTDPVISDDPLATGTIGNGGGSLVTDELILEIPAGAFPGDVEVKVYLDTEEDPFGKATASRVLRIEGMPDHFAEPLTFKLAHDPADPDSLYAMVGGESWVPSRQASPVTWMMEDVRDSLDWAIFELQPVTNSRVKIDSSTPVLVTTVRGVSSLETSDGHFRIYWSPLMATTAQVTSLRGYIDEAMNQYDHMGFQQTGFDDWPVKVLVKPLDWFGHWAPNPRKLGGHLAFSTGYIDDDVEIRLTAGHELLHFCQYFYDPRSIRIRGTVANPTNWLDEATAVYIEDYFAPNDEYTSAARGGRELTALDGLITPNGRSLAEHGYGQSSIIRYLAETEGDDFILKTYADISTGTHAVTALQNQTETDLQDVWQDLLEELITGNIYSDVTFPVLMNYGVYYMHTMNSLADSVGTYGLEYPDLSGQTLFVKWGESFFFNNHQRMDFWCDDAAEYGLSVYGIREPDTIDLLGHAYGPVIVGDLPGKRIDYQSLMLLVSNHHLESDYTGTTGITVQSRLRENPTYAIYDHVGISITYEADWSTSPDNTYAQDMTFVFVPGTFTGSSFSASWDSTNSHGVHYFGHVNVALNPETLQVMNWSAENGSDHADGWSKIFQASGGAIEHVYANIVSLEAKVEDEETCNSIDALSVVFKDNEGLVIRNLDGWNCNSSSKVWVTMPNRNPD